MSATPHAAPITIDGEIRPAVRAPARERWSWALYDFANTIFSMNVGTLLFAVWLVSDLGATNRAVAIASSLASLLVAISIPIFGAISDSRQRRKPWVLWFTLVTAAATVAIGVIGSTMIPPVGEHVIGGGSAGAFVIGGAPLLAILAAYVVANYAYQGALPFYNAMMAELAPEPERGRLSGIGTALGFVGSIVGVLVAMIFFAGGIPGIVALPAGLVGTLREMVPFTSAGGRVAAFVPTAFMLLLFSLPLFFFCRDHNPRPAAAPVAWRAAFATLLDTLRRSRLYPGALLFIVASFLYQDAMGTMIQFMATYAVEAVGFEKGMETTLFVVLTVPAVLGSYLCGLLVDRIGPKRTLMLVIGSWVVLLAAIMAVPGKTAFWIAGAGIGLIFGGVATAERPLLLSLVPDVEAGRFFSLMVLSARTAAILGPLVWAFTVDGLTPSLGVVPAYRTAVGGVAIAMVLALLVLRRVPDTRGRPPLRVA